MKRARFQSFIEAPWFRRFAVVTLVLCGLKAQAVSIHPLGDSITWGYTTASAADTPGGYREPLYRDLALTNALVVTFLGANTGNPGPLLTQNNQVHHDGYPKYTITEVNNNLAGDVPPPAKPDNNGGYWITGTGARAAIFPDDILLLIGSNDNDGGTPATVIEQRLELLVTNLFSLRPNTHLFVASIPPLPLPTDAPKTAIAKTYNQLIKNKTIPKFLVAGRNIRFVDQYPNFILVFSPDGDTVNTALFGDNIHPNEAGYQLMGDTWAAAVLNDPVVPPAAPGALTATAFGANQINLTWTANSTNAGAFLIERSSNNVTFSLIDYVGADVTNYADTGLSAATTNYYRVRAKNTGGDSDYSNVASATTLTASPLAAPGGLTATPGYAKVALRWNASAGAANYNVKSSTTSGGPYTTIAGTSVTNYTDTGLINGTTYYYVVSSVSGGGEGTNSVQVSATPSGMPIAHYRFDFNSLDSSGNGNHGVPVGGLLYGDPQVGANSAQFDGTSSFIEITRVIATNFTVAVWIRTTNTGTGSTWYNGLGILDGEVVGSAADWGCSVLNSKFAVGIGAPDTTFSGTVSINDGLWHHLAATRDSTSGAVKLYVDGALNFTGVAATGPRTAPNELRIGATHSPAPVILNGSLDDMRLYDEVLPASDIARLARPPAPIIQGLALGGGNVVLRGTGGNPNAQFQWLRSTNLTVPAPQWSASAPETFDAGGKFISTNAVNANTAQEFFWLRLY